MKDVQRNILAIAINYKDERYKIFRSLDEVHFTHEYKTIFREMRKLYDENKEVDPLVIRERLGHEYDLTIAELATTDYIRPNTHAYIELLLDNYQRKEALYRLRVLISDLDDKKQSLKEVKNELLDISKIFVGNSDFKDKIYSLNELLVKILTDQSNKTNQIESGFRKLDENVIMCKSKFIIIGGRPSAGKTTLSANIAFNISLNFNTIFFSMETDPEDIAQKIISAQGKIPYSNIINHRMSTEENVKYINAANDIFTNKLSIVNAAGYTVDDVRDKALQEKADVIFIDYLQLINEPAKNNYERVTNISRKLQTLAKQENILVVALSQLRRPEPGVTKKQPTMNDLRESGQLEADADAVLIIWDEEVDDNKKDINKQHRVLSILKNKLGKIGDIRFDFYGSTQLFKELVR